MDKKTQFFSFCKYFNFCLRIKYFVHVGALLMTLDLSPTVHKTKIFLSCRNEWWGQKCRQKCRQDVFLLRRFPFSSFCSLLLKTLSTEQDTIIITVRRHLFRVSCCCCCVAVVVVVAIDDVVVVDVTIVSLLFVPLLVLLCQTSS